MALRVHTWRLCLWRVSVCSHADNGIGYKSICTGAIRGFFLDTSLIRFGKTILRKPALIREKQQLNMFGDIEGEIVTDLIWEKTLQTVYKCIQPNKNV